MKLSEILKDWPKDNYYSHGSLSELPMDEARSAFSEGYSTALTSCDREIDRDELASILYSFKCGHGSRSYTGTEKLMLIDESYCEADHIISTMPTWLKPKERK